MKKIKCIICGIEIEDNLYEDCPYCGWGHVSYEDELEEEEVESFNLMSKKEAKDLLSQGKTVYGEPLPKK